MTLQLPYSLDLPPFRFKALVAHAAHVPLGPEREIALATLLAARLVASLLPPLALDPDEREARATAARAWLASTAMPATIRNALTRLVDATGQPVPENSVPTALDRVMSVTAQHLDPAASSELTQLARAIAGARPA